MTTNKTQTKTQTFRMERTFDASPEQVWTAWTKAEQFAKWISPFGADAEVPEFHATQGGKVRFIMIDDDGNRFPEEVGTFEKLDAPSHLIMDQANDDRDDIFASFPMRMDVRFARVGDKTRMTFVHAGYPPTFPLEEAQKGFTACFDQLAEVVAEHQAVA